MDFLNALEVILPFFGVVTLGFFVWLVRLERKWSALFRGKDTKTLEGALISAQRNFETLAAAHEKLERKVAFMNARVSRSVQGVGTVRFNPFKGTSGSNQSFATAFTNEKGDGVVLSGLYSREHVSVFAKPLKGHESEYELTPEERCAVEEARKQN